MASKRNKFDPLFVRPSTKKKIKLEATKKEKSIVDFMEDLAQQLDKDEEEMRQEFNDRDEDRRRGSVFKL